MGCAESTEGERNTSSPLNDSTTKRKRDARRGGGTARTLSLSPTDRPPQQEVSPQQHPSDPPQHQIEGGEEFDYLDQIIHQHNVISSSSGGGIQTAADTSNESTDLNLRRGSFVERTAERLKRKRQQRKGSRLDLSASLHRDEVLSDGGTREDLVTHHHQLGSDALQEASFSSLHLATSSHFPWSEPLPHQHHPRTPLTHPSGRNSSATTSLASPRSPKINNTSPQTNQTSTFGPGSTHNPFRSPRPVVGPQQSSCPISPRSLRTELPLPNSNSIQDEEARFASSSHRHHQQPSSAMVEEWLRATTIRDEEYSIDESRSGSTIANPLSIANDSSGEYEKP